MFATFDDWTQGRAVVSLATNAGAPDLPFQGWHRFKEAFAPELVARAVSESKIVVKRCLDPFGGSGTTALACQFLGIHPATIEVNPFLADLIEAKLTAYDADALARDFGALVKRLATVPGSVEVFLRGLPPTFVEPGVKERWIFDRRIAARVAAWLMAISRVSNPSHRRFFKVVLGGVLIEVSNGVISGKGRRYRRGWNVRCRDSVSVDRLFCSAVQEAIAEIHRHARRLCLTFEVHRGDCREVLTQGIPCDLAVFSPPYPNSFDYTDVYNIELWTLGYLKNSASNRALRRATLCSHVQTAREFPAPPVGSGKLDGVMGCLMAKRAGLWDHRIPAMVGGYFNDIMSVLNQIGRRLARRGSVWMVVGESCYGQVQIETADIIAELAPGAGWRVAQVEAFRSMRSSPQHGGRPELAETLVVLSRG